MIKTLRVEEDLHLKRFTSLPSSQKPRFPWRELVLDETLVQPGVKVEVAGQDRDFDIAEVAETVGSALTDLKLARQEQADTIFSEINRNLVANVAKAVAASLAQRLRDVSGLRLSATDIYHLIEKELIAHDAHEVARSLVYKRSRGADSTSPFGAESQPVKLLRRNGQIVPWSETKIENAVRKAFLSVNHDSDHAIPVAHAVSNRVRATGQAYVDIETVQDLVQEELMRQGHFKVAEAYILYRAQRAARRQEEDAANAATASANAQESMIVVKRDNGETFFWDGLDLRRRIAYASIGLDLCVPTDEIEKDLRRSLFAEISLGDLKKTIILNAKALIERDADFAKFAGRILLTYIYEEVLGWDIVRDGVEALREAHQKAFKKYLQRGVKIGRISPKLLEFDLRAITEALDPSADLEFDYLGIQTLYDRYLIIDKTASPHRRLETPQFFWMRVAMGLFIQEKQSREQWAVRLYQLYKSRRFCSSTPTLFNSGTLHSQLSSCYLYKVDDSIESIMQRGIAENAYLSKWAGGLGGSWTAVRGTGAYIGGTNGESQGVIPFLKLHNDQLVAVNQGGKRRGSGCAYLETWHNDITDFLELRRNTGDDRRRCHDMNTANWIPDLFMKRMEARQDWTLFRSSETPDLHELYGKAFEERYAHYENLAKQGKIFGQSMPALELWKKMLSMLFETGHPWITFKDPCNVRSPQDHCGVIHSSNLCTEITLNTSADETAVCNLGSVILSSHLKADGSLDLEKLRDTISVAVRALDNVIDINFYPTEAAKTANSRHRPIGLGIMGLADALYLKRLPFASQGAIEFNDEFMEAIAYFAYEASSDLAAERGTYSSYKGSKWDRGLMPQDTLDLLEQERGVPVEVPRGGKMDWTPLRAKIAKHGMRNSNVLAIAPTATISNITACAPCIEPHYRNLYVKSNLSGDFILLNTSLVKDLKALGLWNEHMLDQLKYFDGELADIPEIPDDLKELYKTVFKVGSASIIEAAARRQKWIDQSQSVNLFTDQPDQAALSRMYRAAWRKGLKTTYYLRTVGASSIEKSTVAVRKEPRPANPPTEPPAPKKEYTAEQVKQCSLDAMMNGGTCEACQ